MGRAKVHPLPFFGHTFGLMSFWSHELFGLMIFSAFWNFGLLKISLFVVKSIWWVLWFKNYTSSSKNGPKTSRGGPRNKMDPSEEALYLLFTVKRSKIGRIEKKRKKILQICTKWRLSQLVGSWGHTLYLKISRIKHCLQDNNWSCRKKLPSDETDGFKGFLHFRIPNVTKREKTCLQKK